jgi:uncharacterized damage-inducible protein DinB
VSTGLVDPLRHNAWANAQVLELCQGLTSDQLRATSVGTYGSILLTLQHIIGAEDRYRSRLTGADSAWTRRPEEIDDLDELGRMAEDVAAFWDELAQASFDPERTIRFAYADADPEDVGKEFDVTAGILVAQAINHGNEHRSQIFTILTTLGFEPPELSGWEYGRAVGRFGEAART